MNLSETIKPTPEIISEVKKKFIVVNKRLREGIHFLDDPNIPQSEKDKHLIMFQIEVAGVLEAYFEIIKAWKVPFSKAELQGGFYEELIW